MWGPVGLAEAGVSAGSAATFQKGSAHGVSVGDKLGRGPAPAELKLIADAGLAERLYSCTPGSYSTSFTTSLGSGWSALAARSQTCTSSAAQGYWTGGTFKVTAYTAGGQNICRGGSSSQGSSYWYKTSKGWVWSGGTSDPTWNTNC